MGRFNKNFILAIMLVGIFLLTGCNKLKLSNFNASDKENGTEVTVVPGNNQNNTKSGNPGTDSTDATPTPDDIRPQPTDNKELTVYNVNTDKEEIEPATALVPKSSEITPKLIVTTVVESLKDQSINIGIDQVITKGDAVIVSFTKGKTPYKNMGSGYEQLILDAIGQSLFDNLNHCNKVIYRVDGKPYQSGAFELGINEAYMER